MRDVEITLPNDAKVVTYAESETRLELNRGQAAALFEDLFVALFKDTEGDRDA